MWATVLVLALALNLEPNRLGIIGLLILRPHPIRQLLVFLCTSFVVGLSVGLLVLYVAHRGALLNSGSASATLQIAVGAFALVASAFLFSNIPIPRRAKASSADRPGETDDVGVASSGLPLVDNFTKRLGRFGRPDSTWLAGALGVGISLPSVDYVALLLLIAASDKPPTVQVSALLTFLLVANTILLLPVIAYAFAKERTVEVIEGLRSWVLARSRRDYATLLAIAGILMITVGFNRL